MMWLSGVVVDWAFTSGGMDVRVEAYLFDHRRINVFICVLNFRGWSQLRNYFNSEIWYVYTLLGFQRFVYKRLIT